VKSLDANLHPNVKELPLAMVSMRLLDDHDSRGRCIDELLQLREPGFDLCGESL
jgi:hypothetical protein